MIIIDTHIWIWWTHDIERLNNVQLEAIKANETNTIGVSAISCWEIAKLLEHGKIEELDQDKLPLLLTNKYHSLEDAKEVLGEAKNISSLFIDFQKHLYQPKTA